jgi:hypothetical protein
MRTFFGAALVASVIGLADASDRTDSYAGSANAYTANGWPIQGYGSPLRWLRRGIHRVAASASSTASMLRSR